MMLLLKVCHFIHYWNVVQHGSTDGYTLTTFLDFCKQMDFKTAIQKYSQCLLVYHPSGCMEMPTDMTWRTTTICCEIIDKELTIGNRQLYHRDTLPFRNQGHGNNYERHLSFLVLRQDGIFYEIIETYQGKYQTCASSCWQNEWIISEHEQGNCCNAYNRKQFEYSSCFERTINRWIPYQLLNINIFRQLASYIQFHTIHNSNGYRRFLVHCYLRHTVLQLVDFISVCVDRLLNSNHNTSQFCDFAIEIFGKIKKIKQTLNKYNNDSSHHNNTNSNSLKIFPLLFTLSNNNLLRSCDETCMLPHIETSRTSISSFIEFNQSCRNKAQDLSRVLTFAVMTACIIRVISYFIALKCVRRTMSKKRLYKYRLYSDYNDKLDFVFRSDTQKYQITKLKEHESNNDCLLKSLFSFTNRFPHSIQVFPVFKSALNDHFESNLSDESYIRCNKIELIRVGTFSKFPAKNKPWYLGLARAGFFYTGDSDIVECFHCNIRYGNWNADDDPFEVHRRISPGCEFINSENNLNVPVPRLNEDNLTTRSATINRNTNDGELQTYIQSKKVNDDIEGNTECLHGDTNCQRNAYHGTNSSAETKKRLSDASHANLHDPYQQNGDSADTRRQDKPNHKQTTNRPVSRSESESPRTIMQKKAYENSNLLLVERSPKTTIQNGYIPHVNAKSLCGKITSKNQLKTSEASVPHASDGHSLENNVESKNSNNTLNQQHLKESTVKYPQFSSQNVRASTFHGWPATTGQSPRRMAEAGFVYGGYSDYVRCFFCGEGLSEWEPSDDPWVEHAKWFPHCSFVRKSKGDNFIYLVRQSVHGKNGTISSSTNQEEKPAESHHPRNSSPQVSHTDDDIGSAAIQSVQEMGYSRDIIDTAIVTLQREKKRIDAHNIMVSILTIPASRQESDLGPGPPLSSHSSENSLTTNETASSMVDTLSVYTSSNTQDSNISKSPSSCSNNCSTNTQKTPLTSGREAYISSQFQGLSLSDVESMRNENRLLKESRLCKICQNKLSTIVFVPCGHLVCCTECAYSMVKCPVCRRFIENRIKTWT